MNTTYFTDWITTDFQNRMKDVYLSLNYMIFVVNMFFHAKDFLKSKRINLNNFIPYIARTTKWLHHFKVHFVANWLSVNDFGFNSFKRLNTWNTGFETIKHDFKKLFVTVYICSCGLQLFPILTTELTSSYVLSLCHVLMSSAISDYIPFVYFYYNTSQ